MTRLVTASDGVQLAYHVEGAGPRLLFLHGITDHMGLFDPLVERLSSDYRCARLDFRGHGASSRAVKVSLEGLLLDVEAVLSLFGPAVVVGHSLGGYIATEAAARFPGLVRGVVNLDQPLNMGEMAEGLKAAEPALRSAQFPAVLGALFDRIGVQKLPAALQEEMRAYRGLERQETVLGIWEPLFTSPAEELGARVEATLHRITQPYLALHGEPLPESYLAWIQGQLPRGEIEVWPGLGHYLHWLEPEKTAARVRLLMVSLPPGV